MLPTRLVPALTAVALATVVGACASGSPPSTVDVTLQEWAVLPASPTVRAGSVTFNVANAGPLWNHELVVVKTDLPLDSLPTKAVGSLDEGGAGVAVSGEVADLLVGSSGSVTLDLAPGSYVLVCNIIEDIRVHYQLGMRTTFEVTQ